MMNRQLVCLLAFLGGYVLLILFCEFLNRKARVDSELTRKLAHIISTLSALFYPYVFTEEIYVLALCSACFIALLITNLMRVLHSIDGVGRRTGGSYLLALSVAVSYCVYIKLGDVTFYMLPIFILAICDPLAGLVGKHTLSKTIINGKTVAGSFTFLLSSLFICLAYMGIAHSVYAWRLSVIIALTTTLVELLSPRGLDNLTIPLAVIMTLISVDFMTV